MTPTAENAGEFWWIRWKLTGEVSVVLVATFCCPPTSAGKLCVGALPPGQPQPILDDGIWFEWLGQAVSPEMSNVVPASNAIQKMAEMPVQVKNIMGT